MQRKEKVNGHEMTQPELSAPFARVASETRAASKKTSVTPRLCFALHSE